MLLDDPVRVGLPSPPVALPQGGPDTEGETPGEVLEHAAPASQPGAPSSSKARTPKAPTSGPVGRSVSLDRARRLGWTLIGLQLIGMLVLSTLQYRRYALTTDFGAYSQAWWKIAHGQLDPWSTVFNTAFWKNDAEFLMWPLSLLYHLYPHPVLLLWVQDLAVVATEAIVLGWIIEVIAGAHHRVTGARGVWLACGAAVAIVLDPWVYQTIGFDFHFETIATLFVVLVGRDLWAGKTRRLWWWVALALSSSVLGGLYLFGIGISGVAAGRKTRRTGLLIGVVGLGAFVVLSAFGAAGLGGRLIDAGYAYLVGPHSGHIGVVNIGIGVLGHPGSVIHMIVMRWPTVFAFLVAVGLIGVVSPWGCGMALVVFVPSMLNSNPDFLRLTQSFQSWPALPFVLVGSVMVIIGLDPSHGLVRRVRRAGMAALAASFVVVVATWLPAAGNWIAVSGPAATQLARSQPLIPARAEVIASQGIVGSLTGREYAYPYPFAYHPPHSSSTTFPVNSSLVVFVLTPRQGVDEAAPAETRAAVAYIEHDLGARVIDARSGVFVLEWSPPHNAVTVTLP